MLSVPGKLINDGWSWIEDRVAHCFFQVADGSSGSAEPYGFDVAHAISDDLIHWDYRGVVLRRGEGDEWDSQTIGTGSVIQRDGRYWMAYCGIRIGENAPVGWILRIGMAVSDDLHHWTKYEGNPVSEPHERYYERIGSGLRPFMHWRDAFMFHSGDRVYQFITARRHHEDPNRRGTIAVASSTDMSRWEIHPPIEVDPMAEELEVPQVITSGGKHYLSFSTVPRLLLNDFKQQFPGHPFRRADYSMVGPSPFGPFKIHGTGEILPPDSAVKPYASQIVTWNDKIFLLGTVVGRPVREGNTTPGNEHQDYICDPIPIVADETGLHAVE